MLVAPSVYNTVRGNVVQDAGNYEDVAVILPLLVKLRDGERESAHETAKLAITLPQVEAAAAVARQELDRSLTRAIGSCRQFSRFGMSLLDRGFAIPASPTPPGVASRRKVAAGPLAGVAVAGCLGDQMAAMLGQRCRARQAKNTYGTGCFMLLHTGPVPVPSAHGLLTTVAYQLGPDAAPQYALEGATPQPLLLCLSAVCRLQYLSVTYEPQKRSSTCFTTETRQHRDSPYFKATVGSTIRKVVGVQSLRCEQK